MLILGLLLMLFPTAYYRLNEEMKGVDSLAMRLYPFSSLFIKLFSFHAMREDKFLESLVSLCRLFFRQFLSFIFLEFTALMLSFVFDLWPLMLKTQGMPSAFQV